MNKSSIIAIISSIAILAGATPALGQSQPCATLSECLSSQAPQSPAAVQKNLTGLRLGMSTRTSETQPSITPTNTLHLEQLLYEFHHHRDFFRSRHGVSVVVHLDELNTGSRANASFVHRRNQSAVGSECLVGQPALVKCLRYETAEVRVHPPGAIKKDAQVGGDNGVVS